MGRSPEIKFLDDRGIRDGLLREMITRGSDQMVVECCESSIKRLKDEIDALENLRNYYKGVKPILERVNDNGIVCANVLANDDSEC